MMLRLVFVVVFLSYINIFAQDNGCISCHKGIEDIRASDSDMMKQIKAIGVSVGDVEGCTICHGGDVKAKTKEKAHKGAPNHPGGLSAFVRDPGSIWIADKTCALCHADTVSNMKKALMQTEAGKIQGNLYTWGTDVTQKVHWGNYDVKDEDGRTPTWGTDEYKDYMHKMMTKYPDQFPSKLKQLPKPVDSEDKLMKMDDEDIIKNAAITYQRSDCQRCHIGVRGRKGRGDWRGMGCSACHIPYSNEGLYEGEDPTIDKKQHGHLLVHKIQGTRDAPVHVNGMKFSGLHPETCNSCHNRGKRIGVSYVGLMEQPYTSPIGEGGKPQPKTHGKKYAHIKSDLHFQAGMTCQDCHTSIDMHGDGSIPGTTLAQVEIECSDCHGSNTKYPWELALGYSENFDLDLDKKARGLADKLPAWMEQGMVYKPEGGYLLSTRGNPLGNVVKDAKTNKVTAHLASGKDLEVPLLKTKHEMGSFSVEGKVAMDTIQAHIDKLECYTCHSDWAPQCYGCHVKVDYTKGKSKTDWIASGSITNNSGETLESKLGSKAAKQIGKASETRSYLRWEDPILGVNGEGLITPIIPGCQVTYTIIKPDGKTMVLNKQAQVPTREGGEMVAGTDVSPVQPHTTAKEARTCESCHANPKTLGYGIEDGKFLRAYDKNQYVGLQDLSTGKFIAKNKQPQFAAIPGMDYDWSQVVSRDGKQLQNVGTHWPDSMPLPKKVRDNMERTGLCIGCHKNMDNKDLWKKVDKNPGILSNKDHQKTMNMLLQSSGK